MGKTCRDKCNVLAINGPLIIHYNDRNACDLEKVTEFGDKVPQKFHPKFIITKFVGKSCESDTR